MARYAPLPSVSIDPRNEAELVQAASQVVYEASNRTLNDFSAGNPLAVLLEGQAFAQGEFLFWANQLPDKILLEWIGPFLGAMRRLGTPATALLTVTIPPSSKATVITEGTTFSTNPQLTNGESYDFITNEDLTIPAGETTGTVSVYSKFVGSQYNVPANSITGTQNIGTSNFNCTNLQPAAGGSNVETYEEVRERFFTLIRRRNPVSESDWQDFFVDLFGQGTLTSVQPNRSSFYDYNYNQDYSAPNGQVGLFVLGPNGQELTEQQLALGQNAINFSVPVENQASLYPITLSQVQYNITLEVDANSSFGSDFRSSSLNFRDRLFAVLQPGQTFPSDVNPTVSGIDAAFYSTFDATTRFRDPSIKESVAYNTPTTLGKESATYTQVLPFEPTSSLLVENDLIELNNPNQTFYPVLSDFTPYSASKPDQTIYGNLALKQIQPLTSGSYLLGDVVYYDGYADPAQQGLHVVLENIVISSPQEVLKFIVNGKISGVKTLQPWLVGNSYTYETGGTIDPDLIQYDYAPDEFIPAQPSLIPLNSRPGAFIWLVTKNFTLQASTNDITGAQAQFLIGTPEVPQSLTPGSSYTAGTWVSTPQVGSGPDYIADPYYNYVDITKGAVVKYAYVVASFTYNPNGMTVSEYFDSLVQAGTISIVSVLNGDGGLPLYKYKARFKAGDYLLFKDSALGTPSYYISTDFFTPDSNEIQDLLNSRKIYNLAPTPELRQQLDQEISSDPTLKKFIKMFTFFAGEQTLFRSGNLIKSYTALVPVTPLFDFNIYLNNGIFVESGTLGTSLPQNLEYIPYYDPSYVENAEDTILSEDGRNFYRVLQAFTPTPTVTSWTGMTANNTARFEEYAGNLLRYVSMYRCEEPVLSQFGKETSSIKLGVAQVTIIPKNTARTLNSQPNVVYVWENTATFNENPELSWYTGTTFSYSPPNYRDGTLAL